MILAFRFSYIFVGKMCVIISGIRVARTLVFYVMYCRSLFVLLSFFFWSLWYLSFVNLRLLITPLVPSKFCY